MKVIIQCAASKCRTAGTLRTASGDRVVFVAEPSRCSTPRPSELYARPDESSGEGASTWRDVLVRYNQNLDNPFGLLRAAELYAPNEYEFRSLYTELAELFGWSNVFVLSAGWGLIRADYRTPDYNITFSSQAKSRHPWVWRNAKDRTAAWSDFNHMHDVLIEDDEPIHFFGGKDYQPLFYSLMTTLPGKKIVHFKGHIDRRVGFEYEEYTGPEKNRTWHYRAVHDFISRRPHVDLAG
jgi:hypothetical protein